MQPLSQEETNYFPAAPSLVPAQVGGKTQLVMKDVSVRPPKLLVATLGRN